MVRPNMLDTFAPLLVRLSLSISLFLCMTDCLVVPDVINTSIVVVWAFMTTLWFGFHVVPPFIVIIAIHLLRLSFYVAPSRMSCSMWSVIMIALTRGKDVLIVDHDAPLWLFQITVSIMPPLSVSWTTFSMFWSFRWITNCSIFLFWKVLLSFCFWHYISISWRLFCNRLDLSIFISSKLRTTTGALSILSFW